MLNVTTIQKTLLIPPPSRPRIRYLDLLNYLTGSGEQEASQQIYYSTSFTTQITRAVFGPPF